MACSNRPSHNYSQSNFPSPLTLCLLSFARMIKTWLDLRELQTKLCELSITRESHNTGRLVPSSDTEDGESRCRLSGRRGTNGNEKTSWERERENRLTPKLNLQKFKFQNGELHYFAGSMKSSSLFPFIRCRPRGMVWTFVRTLHRVSHVLFWLSRLKPRNYNVTISVKWVYFSSVTLLVKNV